MRSVFRSPAGLYLVKAIALVCTALAVFPSAARAQYAVSYSGGTTTVNGSPGRPYGPSSSPYPGGWGGGASFAGGAPPGGDTRRAGASPWASRPVPRPMGGTSNTASLGGAITTTATWSGSSPTPPCVVIEQDCTVGWSGGSGATGHCSKPLGGGPTALSPAGQTWAWSMYTVVKNPGASVPVPTCAPTADVTVPFGVAGAITVAYRVVVTPVSINPVGAVQDSSGNWDILIGQQCSPTLAGCPSGCTVSNYSWSVSGSRFQSWTASSSSTAFTDGPGPLNVATPSWYWYDAGNGISHPETVTCSATVTPTAGQGSSFTVNAAQPVNVYVPNWAGTATAGTMQVNSSYPYQGGNPGDYWLYAGGPGMAWTASVTSPSNLFGNGTIELVQTVTPGLSYTTSDGTAHNLSLNGQQNCLDTFYPLPNTGGGASFSTLDSPGLDLTLNAAVSASVKDQFVDYLMYEPPGSGQYVALAQFSWSTNGSAALPMMATSWAGYSGSAGSMSGGGKFSQNNSFPAWTQNVKNGHF